MTDQFKARHDIKVKIVATDNDDRDHRNTKSFSLSRKKLNFDPTSSILMLFRPRKQDEKKAKKSRKSTKRGIGFLAI